MENNFFVKAHGLGNDYVVLDSEKINFVLSQNAIRRICDYHFGIGSDGILLATPSEKADFGVRIFNPDGSEAEKSGNGLRIFGKYLYDYFLVEKKKFTVETLGGIANIEIVEEENGKAKIITIDIGKANFNAKDIPVLTKKAEFFGEKLEIGSTSFEVYCVSVGNPHCTIIKEELDVIEVKHYGQFIENHLFFPNKINVQFAKVISRNLVEILIWERGAGYTLASGSSSCAVASVLYRKGLIDKDVTIKMEGGSLKISIQDDWNVQLTGEVREIASGFLSPELVSDCATLNF